MSKHSNVRRCSEIRCIVRHLFGDVRLRTNQAYPQTTLFIQGAKPRYRRDCSCNIEARRFCRERPGSSIDPHSRRLRSASSNPRRLPASHSPPSLHPRSWGTLFMETNQSKRSRAPRDYSWIGAPLRNIRNNVVHISVRPVSARSATGAPSTTMKASKRNQFARSSPGRAEKRTPQHLQIYSEQLCDELQAVHNSLYVILVQHRQAPLCSAAVTHRGRPRETLYRISRDLHVAVPSLLSPVCRHFCPRVSLPRCHSICRSRPDVPYHAQLESL